MDFLLLLVIWRFKASLGHIDTLVFNQEAGDCNVRMLILIVTPPPRHKQDPKMDMVNLLRLS
jgi:hypothetical protein